ncbi:hypothetical protein J2X97_003665 [Epilithonimonas hungarica]|nr:hypothetical protein [Epilithonimonas hungarica]
MIYDNDGHLDLKILIYNFKSLLIRLLFFKINLFYFKNLK